MEYFCPDLTLIKQRLLDFIQSGYKLDLDFHLNAISQECPKKDALSESPENQVARCLLLSFYHFQSLSAANFDGDSYFCYFHFNMAVHYTLMLYHFIHNPSSDHPFYPENVVRGMENEIERKFLMHIVPEMGAEDVNLNKQDYMDWYFQILDDLEEDAEIQIKILLGISADEYMDAFRAIFNQFYLNNFRQVKFTRHLFRSPDPNRYGNNPPQLENFLKSNGISLIIDLRGDDVDTATNYADISHILKKLKIQTLHLDFNEPKSGATGKGYVKKLIHRPETIKEAFSAIIQNEGSTLFHCASGKDRTGVLAALLQLTLGVDAAVVVEDYTRSGLDARASRIEMVIEYLVSEGGILAFLNSIGFDQGQIETLKRKISP